MSFYSHEVLQVLSKRIGQDGLPLQREINRVTSQLESAKQSVYYEDEFIKFHSDLNPEIGSKVTLANPAVSKLQYQLKID